jgi:acyl carrier protein
MAKDLQSIEQRVRTLVVNRLGVDPRFVFSGASFVDDLGADDLDVVELMADISEEFIEEISNRSTDEFELAEKLRTVGDVIAYIEGKPIERFAEHQLQPSEAAHNSESGRPASYNCDICSETMANKESGFAFERNRVLASPSYWDYFFRDVTDPFNGRVFTEDATGSAVQQLLYDESGYVICSSCKDMLRRDSDKAKEYRLEPWFTSMQARDFKAKDRAQAKELLQAALITIGTVYEHKSGKWPSFVARDEFEARARRWASLSDSATGARVGAPPAPVASTAPKPTVNPSKGVTAATNKKWWELWK